MKEVTARSKTTMTTRFPLQQQQPHHQQTLPQRQLQRRRHISKRPKAMASTGRASRSASGCSLQLRVVLSQVQLLLVLLLVVCPIPVVEASVSILNATALTTASMGNTKYDHQVILVDTAGATDANGDLVGLDDRLVLRWNDPTDTGVLTAALEHTTQSSDNKPSWLALGVFDASQNTVPIFDDTLDQVNGQAVIGTMFFANPAVFKYSLGDPHGPTDDSAVVNGGVALMPDDHQTLIFQNMEQLTITQTDGSVAIRTVLMFDKNLDEGDDKEEATLKESGDNILVWALGPPGMETLGMHDQRGAFRLDFQAATTTSSTTTTAEPLPQSQQESPAGTTTPPAATATPATATNKFDILNATDIFQPIANQGGPFAEFDHQVQVDKNLMFYWANPTVEGVLKARLEHRAESDATAPSWLSLGFYDVPNNPMPVTPTNFVMDGSTAIIGTTWVHQENPYIYSLGYNHDQPGIVSIMADQEQHLAESSMLQFTNTDEGEVYTTLSFQKNMKHPSADEPPIVASGDNIFLWAMGPPGALSLGMHSEYGAMRLDLLAASGGGNSDSTTVPEGATIKVVEANNEFVTSTDENFDYQVQLERDLMFRWEAPDEETGLFTGRLEHTTKYVEAAPAWLGFGFPNPRDTSTLMLMQNTYAIIGLLPSEKVEKYSLGANNNHTTGFVQALPPAQQTLKVSKMMQSHNPDTGIYKTTLFFAKLLVEESNPLEAPILTSGENRFLWAVGNALTPNPTLGMHRDFGAMTVDFSKVAEKANDRPASVPVPTQTTPAPVPSTETNDDSGSYSAPVIVGRCSSSVFENSGMSIKLTPELEMHWQVNVPNEAGFAEFGLVASVTVVLEYNGLGWLGFGISPTSQAHSLGATAIIGIPTTKNSPQLKYNISADNVEGTVPMTGQTLIESFVNQEEGTPGLTTLRFTKAMVDGVGEVVVKRKGLNFFSFAVGSGNRLGYHKNRDSFQLDLSECYDVPPGYDTNKAQNADVTQEAKGALKAHAIMASIAWGFAMPCAVGIAWFRQLIPTTWIYIHVSFNLLTFVLTLVAVLMGVAAVSSRDNSSHLTKGHHVVGVLLFVAYTFQVANGFLRPPVQRKDDGSPVERAPFSLRQPESARELWHLIHRSMGIIMLFVGIFQIASGIRLWEENFESGRDYFFWYWTYVSLFGLTLISLKIWLVMQNRRARGQGASWVEDRASTSVGIDSMMQSDPDGMDVGDDCVVLEIPSRGGGGSTVIRGARRVSSNIAADNDESESDNMTVEIT